MTFEAKIKEIDNGFLVGELYLYLPSPAFRQGHDGERAWREVSELEYQTKQSLVYDLQEPFRWIADVTVMEAFESGVLDLPDFYFTGDDYRYRFNPEAKQRFLELCSTTQGYCIVRS